MLARTAREHAPCRTSAWIRHVLLACVTVASAALCAGQGQLSVPTSAEQSYKLHVYEDLVQVPTLVLNRVHDEYRGLNEKSFTIRLDSGPAFPPRHVRQEGDDPITLALLLDDSESGAEALTPHIQAALAGLPAGLLTDRDHVSVFAFDCNLVRSVADQPASNATLETGIDAALQSAALHRAAGTGSVCKSRIALWDSIGAVAKRIGDLPGRRVVVVITDGVDKGSHNSWQAVRHFLTGLSITVFGVQPATVFYGPSAASRRGVAIGPFGGNEDPLGLLCAGTGGVKLASQADTLSSALEGIVGMVRARYILEFARPSNGTAGRHTIDVTLRDDMATVRPSGITIPLQDKALQNDPNTVPTDTSRAPQLGTRRVLPDPNW